MNVCCISVFLYFYSFFFFQAEDGIRDATVTGVQTCALPIWLASARSVGSCGARSTRCFAASGGRRKPRRSPSTPSAQFAPPASNSRAPPLQRHLVEL